MVDDAGGEFSTAGEEGSTVNRRQREEGSSPVLRDEILTTEEVCTLLKIKKGDAVPAYQPGDRTAVLQDQQVQPLEAQRGHGLVRRTSR